MEIELRRQALACVEKNITEVQVVIVVLTRELAFKIARQLNEDAGEIRCLPCVNDRQFELQLNEMRKQHFAIVVGTLGRIDLFLYRNVLS
ncbi:hypothetical protein LOAG_11289 [Loa loa]|uniref:DEAD/DEAH-box helicase domain-containing protein n=1 Tax=Loa loa TaxID=7209 RepID=A0A1S0TN99_LOALO|nr:hypothetical protein LOAG_11289 [Loa loa]EFO17213.1 hypothetical protein LOAG_11289 [Loa loa]